VPVDMTFVRLKSSEERFLISIIIYFISNYLNSFIGVIFHHISDILTKYDMRSDRIFSLKGQSNLKYKRIR
jgi:hypothetical protein